MMLVLNDPREDSRELQFVQHALQRGELAIVPTDTVYGIAAAADNVDACARLAEVKGRSTTQPIAVIFRSRDDVFAKVPDLSVRARWAVASLLPGPFTVICANPARAYAHVCGASDDVPLGIRIPANALALEPIAATSANPTGGRDPLSVADLDQSICEHVACVVDRGQLVGGVASTVLDLTAWEQGGDIVMLRDGGQRAGIAIAALASAPDPA